ncbi:MAG: hypothetical protein A2Z02_06985 [Chloroflexi bacterium RBG_16_48_7]|nr:MAG: hypothetical protein A2Z02_06985 [Chloroflexi bacterium RBG_16_48_7]
MGVALISTEVPATAYQYARNLKCGSSYYWRVRAVAPFPSDWSATYTFLTGSEAKPAPSPAAKTASQSLRASTGIVMIMIGIGTLLIVCVLILVMRTRRD